MLGRFALGATVLFALLTQIPVAAAVVTFNNEVIYNLATAFTVVGSLWLPRHHPNRKIWILLGVSETLPVIGELFITGYYGGYEQLPFPSFADVLFLGFYPVALAALIMLYRTYGRGLRARTFALDSIITSLTVLAYLIWLILDRVLNSIDGDAATRFMILLPTTFDIITVVLIAVFLVIVQPNERQPWMLLLLLAIGVRTFADMAYYIGTSNGTYTSGTILDAGWPAAAACYIYAAISFARPSPTPRAYRSWLILTIPSLLGACSLALLVIDRTLGGVPSVSVALAVVTVVLVGLRNVTAYRELQHLAIARRDLRTDELTGIGNRRAVNELLHDRISEGAPFGVIIMDLDRFKEVNDSLGHAAGDDLLRLVAERLENFIGPNGFVARLAGDEFAAIAPTGELDDSVLCELHMELVRPYQVKEQVIHIGASMGLASFPLNATTATEVLGRSDHAMYRAKVTRSAWVRYDGDLDLPERDRLALNEGLRESIAQGLVVPHYQAKMDLDTRQLVGFEALARWEHPEHGIISPSRFLPIAERAGLMVPLTLSIIAAVARDIRRADELGGLQVSVAVNIDVQALATEQLPADIKGILAEASVDPARIVFEVTESSIMADRATSIRTLNRLRELGCSISIDDYGTGYSSLAYLRDLPVNELKLDRTFAERVADPVTKAIIRSTVALADELGLSLVAEGIENQQTALALQLLGCKTGQGYLFHRPMPFAAIEEELLQSHAAAESSFGRVSPL
jgi:diguanylate cyclase (GGDEF)-like protein